MSDPSARRATTDPRISRRRRAVARSKRKKIVTGLAIVAALGGIGWGALASPLLAIDEVKVVGARHVTSRDVARVAGIGPDDNLLLLSTGSVEDAAETLPWVKVAVVDRMLPGTVRVRITERVPVMVVSLGAARWTIDGAGRVLDSGAAARDLPILGGAELGDIRIGRRLTTPEILDALRVFRSMAPRIRSRIVAVFAPSFERISFSLEDGTLIRVGAAEHLDAKNHVLQALLARLKQQGRVAAYIDVRVPTSPAVAPRGAIAPATAAPATVAPEPTPTP